MKRTGSLFLLLITIIATSCSSTPDSIPEKISISGYNFSKYSNEGFLFTPNVYNGEYESVGLIHLTYTPEANLVEVYSGKQLENGKPQVSKEWHVIEFDSEILLDNVYEACLELGADAFTQMVLQTHSETYGNTTMYPLILNGAKISGFAIKRLKE